MDNIVLCVYGHFACRGNCRNCKAVETGKFLLLGLMCRTLPNLVPGLVKSYVPN